MVASLNVKNSRADENSKQTNIMLLFCTYLTMATLFLLPTHYFEYKENSGRAYLDTGETSSKRSTAELKKKENTELQETERSNF